MKSRLAISTCLALLVGGPVAAEPYTNRLAASADPYLLEHAHNPVDWYPWGPEAFAKAKAEDKPIFLSIGYSTCFWCHVAERTIYSDPAIAATMNKWFVNIKVDREERPDVDHLYILATQMLTDHGAWPNNLFLTPDGKPFYAGSYFPPADDGGVPGFPKVLAALHDLWMNHRADKVEPTADEVMVNLRALERKQAAAAAAPVTPAAWLGAAAASLERSHDPLHGGFGSPTVGPKFPQASALALLAAAGNTAEGDAAAGRALQDTLDGMAMGGLDDQLAGGFFRYTSDPAWSLPHYEKMLSDNAQLLALYADAYARTHDPLDRAAAEATAGFLLRNMRLPDGTFATALDAQTQGREGATYLWTRAEIEEVLGPADTERFLAAYELTPAGEPDDRAAGMVARPGVLRLRLPIGDMLRRVGASDIAGLLAGFATSRAKLLAARDTRPQPLRDDKAVVALNGLAIAALANAGRALDAAPLRAAAEAAAARLWSTAYDEASGELRHQLFAGTAAVAGDLSDYAMFGGGLLSLADAGGVTGGDAVWRKRATLLADALLRHFARPDGGLATGGTELLPVALGDDADADVPSGTSAALALLGRLGAAPGGECFAQAQARAAERLAGRIAAHPTMWPSAIVALAANPPANAATGTTPPAAQVAGPTGVPSTADHVHATASLSAGGGRLTVALTVDPGYHVNAHVPSLPYLVPTSLDIAGAAPTAMDYPPAASFTTGFSATPLAVYEGTVALTATLPTGAAGWRASVTTQACTAQTCLPPATLAVPTPAGSH